MNWPEWKNTKAADRIQLHGQVADAFSKKEDKVNLFSVIHDSPQHFDLLRELAIGESRYCNCCEESCPEVMMYDGRESDDEWEDGIEADIVGDYEWSVCAWCIQNKREETTCENCGCSEWRAYTLVGDGVGGNVKMPTPCTRLVDGETVVFPEHSMILKHPYKEASE